MKKYISLLAVPALALLMGACDKETEGQTWIVTYEPEMEILGESYQSWEAGVPYNDPGVNVTLDGKPLSDPVTVSTSMDFDNPQPGFYSIVYSLTTADGKVAQGSRNVAVYSDLYPAQGWYKVDMAKSSYNSRSYLDRFGEMSVYVKVKARFDGNYDVSDLMGGFYETIYGYGSNYALTGVINIDNSNVVTILSTYLTDGSNWAHTASSVDLGSYDPSSSTLQVGFVYNYPYDVSMTKVN